jgi:Family of unknown function (DUF5677)
MGHPRQLDLSNMKKTKKQKSDVHELLMSLHPAVMERAFHDMPKEGLFRGVLRSCFVKAFEFSQFIHSIEWNDADESAYFSSAALRGICEDLIVLKFLHQLPKKIRDEVIGIQIFLISEKTVKEQTIFFKERRPFQPVISYTSDPAIIEVKKQRLTEIGKSSGLWRTEKKLPPIEQMAAAIKMRPIYDYIYRITSDTVHFNPRIAMRDGWGSGPRDTRFSTLNFCKYYLNVGQTFGFLLFDLLCSSFANDLRLDQSFKKQLKALRKLVNGQVRWPEAMTYEEMNVRPPNIILRAALMIAHEEGLKPETVIKTIEHGLNLGNKSKANVKAIDR